MKNMIYDTAIVGGGPAGLMCARRLAGEGQQVILFDFRIPCEKTCGGMISEEVFSRYGELLSTVPVNRIFRAKAVAPNGVESYLYETREVGILQRIDLSQQMLGAAEDAGVTVVHSRVEYPAYDSPKEIWVLHTDEGEYSGRILVGADGVNSTVRTVVAGDMDDTDLALCCGYTLHKQGPLENEFVFSDFQGYEWIFDRPRDVSAGIIARKGSITGKELFTHLDRLLMTRGLTIDGKKWVFPVPSAAGPAFFDRPFCGANWLLAGDAAGFADPVSGEGILYALASGDCAAEAILKGDIAAYRELCEKSFLRWLRQNSTLVEQARALAGDENNELFAALLYKAFRGC